VIQPDHAAVSAALKYVVPVVSEFLKSLHRTL
jgi:hypothetical protein